MLNSANEKHKQQFPNVRSIRRACNRELYRTVKKLKVRIAPEPMKQAEELYLKKVMLNLPFIMETGSNRKALADWWEQNVSAEIAPLWNVDVNALNRAFRDSFGG